MKSIGQLSEQEKEKAEFSTKKTLSNMFKTGLGIYNKGKDCVKTAQSAAALARSVTDIVKSGQITPSELMNMAASVGLSNLIDPVLGNLPGDSKIKIDLNVDPKFLTDPKKFLNALSNSQVTFVDDNVEFGANRRGVKAKAKKGAFSVDAGADFRSGDAQVMANVDLGKVVTGLKETNSKNDMKLIMENWRYFCSSNDER